jgi:hypothetical protein
MFLIECRTFGAHFSVYFLPGLTAGPIGWRPFGPAMSLKKSTAVLDSGVMLRKCSTCTDRGDPKTDWNSGNARIESGNRNQHSEFRYEYAAQVLF